MIDEQSRVHAMGEAAQLVDRLLGVGAQLAERPPEPIVRHRLGLRVASLIRSATSRCWAPS